MYIVCQVSTFVLLSSAAYFYFCLLAKITSSSIPFTNDTRFLRDITVHTQTHLHIQTCTRMDSTQHTRLVGIAYRSRWLLFNADPTEYLHPSRAPPPWHHSGIHLTYVRSRDPSCRSCWLCLLQPSPLVVCRSVGCIYASPVLLFTCRLRDFSFLLTSRSPANSVSMETWGRVCQGDVCFLTPCVQRDTNYLWVSVCNCIMHMHVWFCWK